MSISEALEEERFEEFKMGRYYPVDIGEIFSSKYQVIGKNSELESHPWYGSLAIFSMSAALPFKL